MTGPRSPLVRFFSLFLAACLFPAVAAETAIPLDGTWRFELDRKDAGLAKEQSWYGRVLTDKIRLPGVLQAQGFGDEISADTPWVLSLHDRNWHLRADYQAHAKPGNTRVPFLAQPPRHYLGVAWYQREVDIPREWSGRRVGLFLERPRWETRVWLNDTEIGSNNSLCAPHEFDLGPAVPGKHRLTIRVDNRMLLPYRPDAHGVSDSLGSSWNGLVGTLELRSLPAIRLDRLQTEPDVAARSVLLHGVISNPNKTPGGGTVRVETIAQSGASPTEVACEVTWGDGDGEFSVVVPLGNQAQLWDEFHPALHRLKVKLATRSGMRDEQSVTFGLREFRRNGRGFTINGRPTRLRGTHHGGDFPLTGYPPCDPDYWRGLFKTCKAWGLNHVRFHSFCPPKAAFTAADELGIYLLPEPGMWNTFNPGSDMETMLYQETERILRAYGNHPSFVMFSPSNEPKGRWQRVLPKWADHFRKRDSNRLYSSGTGFTDRDAPGPIDRIDFTTVGRVGPSPVRRESGWFGRDYHTPLKNIRIPVIGHEIGQWCAYPDFRVIDRFTGYLRPGNYEIFRDSAAAKGLLERNREFADASGRLQFECYKEEIEANLRTWEMAGYQLLDLHDYLGQGTALVGILDPFWQPKSHADQERWRQFCAPTVPLARLTQRVFTTADTIDAKVEIAHFGEAPLPQAKCSWEILDGAGKSIGSGDWPALDIPLGHTTLPEPIRFPLKGVTAPDACRLVVNCGPEIRNEWKFWVYPADSNKKDFSTVTVTRSWNDAEQRLANGGKVIYLPPANNLGWDSPPLSRVPVFWNALMGPSWGRMLGLWCDAKHPALAGFPTEHHGDWQWGELLRNARAINLDRMPRTLKPIASAIDDWNRNWNLGVLFEAKVGRGSLLVCSLDLSKDLEKRPAARQLLDSLKAYASGDAFAPKAALTPEQCRSLWFDSQLMRKLGAKVSAPGSAPDAVLDGNPNTSWTAGGGKTKHPYALTVSFPQPVALDGILLMNRQNDRNHIGDIRGYRLEASDDGQAWQELPSGELPSTWDPQTVRMPKTLTTRNLRLTALSGYPGDATAALAEFSILYAGPPLPETVDGSQPSLEGGKSTSPEIY